MKIAFTKMQGIGNDYIYVNAFAEKLPADLPELSRKISDRHFGIGGDGLIVIHPSGKADVRMQMFNADGSESEMCGNGIRCVSKYVYDHAIAKKDVLKIETGAGILTLHNEVESGKVRRVRVDMGEPILDGPKIPTLYTSNPVKNEKLDVEGRIFEVTCVSMGNPHCVIFVEKADDDIVLNWGKKIEHHKMFPRRINVEFIEVISRAEVKQRTWERGSGETLACGTGASAVCVAGFLTGRTDRKILNHLLGGDLELEWDEKTNHVFKTGPAVEVFSGVWEG